MKERNTLFLPAIARSRESASASVIGPGSDIGRARRIASGTTASISASIESNPSAASISCASSGEGPMWRARNASCASSDSSAGRVPAGDCSSLIFI